MRDDRETVRGLPCLQPCDDESIDTILRLGVACTVSPGQSLTTEGAPGREAFLVLDGTARVTAGGHVIAHVGPGELVGDVALIDNDRRSATVTAESAMSVLVFDAPGFSALLDDPAVSRAVRRSLAARLRAAINPSG
jgi:CRP/FNR family transcriptional regulator, cyclic AMP receptor protein